MHNLPISKDSIMPVQNVLNLVSLHLRRQLFNIMYVYYLLSYNIICPGLLAQVSFRILSYNSRNQDLFGIPSFKFKSNNDSSFVKFLKLANFVSLALDFFNTTRDTFILDLSKLYF